MARKVYEVYAPKEIIEKAKAEGPESEAMKEIIRRCKDFKKRQDKKDDEVEQRRLNSPVFVPTSREAKEISRYLSHKKWLEKRGVS